MCMVVYHAFYDIIFFFSVNIPAFHSPVMNFIRDLFVFGFIFISGASARLSRNSLKRGALCFGIGMLMTLFTLFFMPEQIIMFGILHCLGVCMMLHPILRRVLDKIPAWLGVVSFFLLFFLTYAMPYGYLGIEGLFQIEMPAFFYESSWLFPIGLPSNGFFSADYFPLIPWAFAFLIGSYFGRWLKNGNAPRWLKKTHIPPLAFIGRHTLWVYVLHQPVIYGVLYVVMMAFGKA